MYILYMHRILRDSLGILVACFSKIFSFLVTFLKNITKNENIINIKKKINIFSLHFRLETVVLNFTAALKMFFSLCYKRGCSKCICYN